jgi:hypothetical protein
MRSGCVKTATILARALRAASRLVESSIGMLVAATVFAFAAGSSSVDAVSRVGHPLRWVLLFVLLAAAAVWALGVGARPERRSAIYAAAAFVALALLSSAWSVTPRLSVERAATVGALFAAGVLVAAAAARVPGGIERPLDGLVVGAVAVAAAGLVLLAVDHGTAIVPATIEVPTRYRGFGQDANTSALLFGVAASIALWGSLAPRPRNVRIANALAVALFLGSLAASGSRGGLAAFAVGSVATLVAWGGRSRWTLAAVGVAAGAVVVAAFIQSIPQPTPLTPPPATATQPAAPAPPKPRYTNVDDAYPLDSDVGAPLPGGGQPTVRRSYFGDSGRLRAWIGALHQVVERPLLGFGFGSERAVFVDRYYGFVGGLPENSYIGLGLQLGAAGLVGFLVLVALLARAGVQGLRRMPRGTAAAGLGALAAGLTAAVVQSYVYSVGDIATTTFWLAGFLLLAAASTRSVA